MEEKTTTDNEVIGQDEIMAKARAAYRGRMKTHQTFQGENVKVICGCAVLKIDDTTVVHKLPVTYDSLLAAAIKSRYSSDRAEAITANYLEALADPDGEKSAEHIEEYREYQAWRTKAKEAAKEAMGIDPAPDAETPSEE